MLIFNLYSKKLWLILIKRDLYTKIRLLCHDYCILWVSNILRNVKYMISITVGCIHVLYYAEYMVRLKLSYMLTTHICCLFTYTLCLFQNAKKLAELSRFSKELETFSYFCHIFYNAPQFISLIVLILYNHISIFFRDFNYYLVQC